MYIIDWLVINANWVFSGIGVVIVVAFCGSLRKSLSKYIGKNSDIHGDGVTITKKAPTKEDYCESYLLSDIPKYPEKLKKFVTENRADDLRKALTYLENHRILLISGLGGIGKSTFARALVEHRPSTVPEPF